MDESTYISSVKEQLRAYGFDERGAYSVNNRSLPYFHKVESSVTGTTEEAVFIVKIDESTVDAIKQSIADVVGIHDWEESNGFLDRSWLYVLVVPNSVTKAMRIAAKREAGSRDGTLVLPIVADFENGALIYEKSSLPDRLTGRNGLMKKAERYFVTEADRNS